MRFLVPILLLAGPLAAAPTGSFIEDSTPFLRSSLDFPEDRKGNTTRRGVLLPLGESRWACFDTDLLRWSAIWSTPDPLEPTTKGTMASVSYPFGKAKAGEQPWINGTLIAASEELPGASPSGTPAPDPRVARTIGDDPEPIGALPPEFGRWFGISLRGKTPVLHYRIGSTEVSETMRATAADRIERLIHIGATRQTLSFRLPEGEPSAGRPSLTGPGARLIRQGGKSVIRVEPSAKPRTLRIELSPDGSPSKEAPSFPEQSSADPLFPEPVAAGSAGETSVQGPFSIRNIPLPQDNPQGRVVRPTDIAFLSGGDAIVSTLDGDIWRVSDIGGESASWLRIATGLYETIAVETNDKDEIFTLGRDQITRLIDVDNDGHIDIFRNASDAFIQSIDSRDYSTSLEIEPDGSFLIAKGGLERQGPKNTWEMSPHRGTVLRISPDGLKVEILADGLRLPYVGLRKPDGIFASDQQGNFVPSSPVHRIDRNVPSFGHEPTDFRHADEPNPPLLWYPYQNNRSGASFATLSAKGFPDLPDTFAHISWNGRLFPVLTPDRGIPFSFQLPIQLDYPALAGATHPATGSLFTAGIGISGYKPTTPGTEGIAEIRQSAPFPSLASFEIRPTALRLSFASPLPENLHFAADSDPLRLWNIRRSREYGSGHFRWDGKPGEHHVQPTRTELAADRRSLTITVPPIFRSTSLALRLVVTDSTGAVAPYPIEIFARPDALPEASSRDLRELAKREEKEAELLPGDPAAGKPLFTSFGCIGCHSTSGEKLTGPPLSGLAGKHGADAEAFLRESILKPAAVIADGYEPAMPSFEGVIPPQQLEHLIAYLKTL